MPYNREDLYKIKRIDLTNDATVAHTGGTETQTLQPDVGFVYEIIDIYIDIPYSVGDTAGTHELSIKYQNQTEELSFIKSAFNNKLTVGTNGYYGSDTESPTAMSDQLNIMRHSIAVSHDQPLDFVYTNDLDADNTGTRAIEILVKQYREAV